MNKCVKCKKSQDEDQFISVQSKKPTKTCAICRGKMRKYNSEPHNKIAINASKTTDERIASRKEYNKKYYEDVFKLKYKEYYKANRERYLETARRHNEKNPRRGSRARVYETVTCGCGGHYQSHQINRHQATIKHSKWADENADPNIGSLYDLVECELPSDIALIVLDYENLWKEKFNKCIIDLKTYCDDSTCGHPID